MGINLDEKTTGQLQLYMRLLLEWNEKMNLTAVTEPLEIVRRHFLDSLSLAAFADFSAGGALVDVGSGAGFPGLPLKLAFPALRVTFLDSLQKRLTFLDAAAAQLQLTATRTLHARAEEAGRMAGERQTYGFATARAVAALPVLAEYCLPLVRTGGLFLAMKGPDAAREVQDARHAVETLGGKIRQVKTFTLPQTDYGRSVVVIEKVKPTPQAYPRTAAKIKEKPL